MRERLIQYVELLFAGAPNSGEIKQEILQNTLDRYDDLVEQGKSPEAAYRLAITGIGDINEILGNLGPSTASPVYTAPAPQPGPETEEPAWKKILRATAIGLYILSVVPLFILSELGMDTIGLCGTLSIVAVATVAIIFVKKGKNTESNASTFPDNSTPAQDLRRSIRSIIWALGLAVYFILSFLTNAWYITWLIFPIIGSVQGLAYAIADLKEANKHEA